MLPGMLPASWFMGRGSGWYRSYSSWGWSLVDFSSYLIANHQPPQPFLKDLGKKWRWHLKHTNCAYRHYLKGHSCTNMPPLVERMFNENSRPDTLNVKRRAVHYTTSFISQGEEHQGLWGHRLDESHLTWLQVVTLLTSESKRLSASRRCVFRAVVWRAVFLKNRIIVSLVIFLPCHSWEKGVIQSIC